MWLTSDDNVIDPVTQVGLDINNNSQPTRACTGKKEKEGNHKRPPGLIWKELKERDIQGWKDTEDRDLLDNLESHGEWPAPFTAAVIWSKHISWDLARGARAS